MSTAQPSKNPGVKGTVQQQPPTVHQTNTYTNKGVAPGKPRGMGC